MAKIVLNGVTNGYNVSTINANFQKLEDAINEEVLFRDNPVGEPNQMKNDLDMNGKRVYNLPEPVEDHEAARYKDVKVVLNQLDRATEEADRAEAAANEAQRIADEFGDLESAVDRAETAAETSVSASESAASSASIAEEMADNALASAEDAQEAASIAEQVADMNTYLTKAEADDAMPLPEGTIVRVTNDSNPDNNGYWVSDGTVLVKSGFQPINNSQFEEVRQQAEESYFTTQGLLEYVPPRVLSGEYAHFLADENGDGIAWVNRGESLLNVVGLRTLESLLQMFGRPMLGQFEFAIVNQDGYVLFGQQYDGTLDGLWVQGGGRLSNVYIENGYVWALVDGVPYQLTDRGVAVEVSAQNGVARYIARHGVETKEESTAVPTGDGVAPFVVELLHALSSGQSLSVGSFSQLTTIIPPCANRLLTMQVGSRASNVGFMITPEQIVPPKPMVSATNETPVVQLAAQLLRNDGLPPGAGMFVSATGIGGQSIAALSKGGSTNSYANAMAVVTNMKQWCDDNSLAYRVPFIDWIQGENDRNAASGYYYGALVQLQSDYESDINTITGRSDTIPVLLDQISNWASYGNEESFVPLEQLQVALDMPDRFVCAGPKYAFETVTDGRHLTGMSSMRAGCMHARAAQAIINGQQWLPTHCISAVRTGSTIILEFHTPSGPLVIDTQAVTDPGNYGLRYVDDDDSASIQSVRLLGMNRVLVTLDTVPTGANPFIGIADIGVSGAAGGPTTGPRSNFRDSSPDKDHYGNPVYNWACHQRISVLN